MSKQNKKPTHYAYTVRDNGKKDNNFWTKIGAAFAHEDGNGFNVVLDALPVDGRLTIRKPKEKDDS